MSSSDGTYAAPKVLTTTTTAEPAHPVDAVVSVAPLSDEDLRVVDDEINYWRDSPNSLSLEFSVWQVVRLRERLRQEVEHHALTNCLAKGYLADLNATLGELAAERESVATLYKDLDHMNQILEELEEAVRAYGRCPTSHNEQRLHQLVGEDEG